VIGEDVISFVGEILKHPAVPCGRRVLQGPADWRELAWRGSQSERAAVLRHVGRRELLLATSNGRRRLRRWIELKRQNTVFPTVPPIFGSPGDAAVAEAALARLPQPVRDMAALECNVWADGVYVLGCFSPPPDLSGRWLLRATGATEAAMIDTLLHEAGHFWGAMEYTHHHARTVSEQTLVYERAAAAGFDLDGLAHRRAEEHRLIDALILAWRAA
jgi:hypothetical protein